jgi:hypothetical protein
MTRGLYQSLDETRGSGHELFPKMSGSIEWAMPLTRPVAFERKEGGRVFFSITAVY